MSYFLVMLFFGQFEVPNFGTSLRIAPPLYIDYIYGDMQVETKVFAKVEYNRNDKEIKEAWRVPIVNGYVPTLTVQTYSDGSQRYVFDYRKRIPYAKPEPPPPKPPPVLPKPEPPKLPPPLPTKREQPLPKLEPTRLPEQLKLEPPIPAGMERPSDIADPVRVISPDYKKED